MTAGTMPNHAKIGSTNQFTRKKSHDDALGTGIKPVISVVRFMALGGRSASRADMFPAEENMAGNSSAVCGPTFGRMLK